MALIFDGFKTKDRAEAFATEVTTRFGRPAAVFDDQNSMHAPPWEEVFPFVLTPPIVLVERYAFDSQTLDEICAAEAEVEEAVTPFGGVYAGT